MCIIECNNVFTSLTWYYGGFSIVTGISIYPILPFGSVAILEVKFCIRDEHVFCSWSFFVSISIKLNVLLNFDENYLCGIEGKNCLLFDVVKCNFL